MKILLKIERIIRKYLIIKYLTQNVIVVRQMFTSLCQSIQNALNKIYRWARSKRSILQSFYSLNLFNFFSRENMTKTWYIKKDRSHWNIWSNGFWQHIVYYNEHQSKTDTYKVQTLQCCVHIQLVIIYYNIHIVIY